MSVNRYGWNTETYVCIQFMFVCIKKVRNQNTRRDKHAHETMQGHIINAFQYLFVTFGMFYYSVLDNYSSRGLFILFAYFKCLWIQELASKESGVLKRIFKITRLLSDYREKIFQT